MRSAKPVFIDHPVPYIADLDTPLLQPGKHPEDAYRGRDAVAGNLILGATSSAKSTGSAAAIILAWAKAGYGMSFQTAKKGEFEWIMHLMKLAGREKHVIRISPDSGITFPWITHFIESEKAAGRQFSTANLVNYMLRVFQRAHRMGDLQGKAPEQPFWDASRKELLTHTINCIYGAYGTLDMEMIRKFINSAPLTARDRHDEASFHNRTMRKLASNPAVPLELNDLDLAADYFEHTWGKLDHRTRSNVVISLTSLMAPVLGSYADRILNGPMTWCPELLSEGVVTVFDFSVKEENETGLILQTILKLAVMRHIETRKVDDTTRPIAIIADEAAYFVGPEDEAFLQTARSSKGCVLYITQSISSFYAAIGGSNPRETTASFLTNFTNKWIHNVSDPATTQYLADAIGKRVTLRSSSNRNAGGSASETQGVNTGLSFQDGHTSAYDNKRMTSNHQHNETQSSGDQRSGTYTDQWSSTKGMQEQMDYAVQPGEFGQLRTGGPHSDWHADAVWIAPSRKFKGNKGENYLLTSFEQVLM